ncbi:MAG TPA: NADH-ubiquinone oxidoreductase-F iron-sulfur binding region domain-containing protein [Candidatus Limnocylindrales bacterium]|jgi:NADH:ubiquinone oxidoreductase subunit F (NADH-binding)|nr:NADH-ubiquinone oxidoreductase-F iron-sulfur binding region domain-containing protein [Candidatus Limnocylindrales bacterium]
MISRVLAGPAAAGGAESIDDHLARLGRLPSGAAARHVIPVLEASGLLGRGGAGFPVGRKWRTVAERRSGPATVLVNAAEGEPLSAKDRTLLRLRPHLVLDGAFLAADAVGAERVVLYVGSAHRDARTALERALRERGPLPRPVDLIDAPDTYVAGEESAAVHMVNDADARPTSTPPRVFERGIGGRPTLVQNVESLAHAALIGRYGDAWYRELGRGGTPGSALVTVSGSSHDGIREIELGTTIGQLAAETGAGSSTAGRQAVLLGGYFGGWVSADRGWDLPLDPVALRQAGTAFGCGVVAFLGEDVCGVRATSRIMGWMAGQSAAQCGPCVFGLRAIADATARVAGGTPEGDELERLRRWAGQIAGRGACRHPDGAVGQLLSSLRVFEAEWELHQRRRACSHERYERSFDMAREVA